ncbi:hypothetical protein MHU86_22487 [Fragilaria crotonensis]|nr:hypothetical protein MHU86_22487 [Fragilaria crotonensis]
MYYQEFYKEMLVKGGLATKNTDKAFLDTDGDPTTTDANTATGFPTRGYTMCRPDKLIFVDKVGSNTSTTTKDGNVWESGSTTGDLLVAILESIDKLGVLETRRKQKQSAIDAMETGKRVTAGCLVASGLHALGPDLLKDIADRDRVWDEEDECEKIQKEIR